MFGLYHADQYSEAEAGTGDGAAQDRGRSTAVSYTHLGGLSGPGIYSAQYFGQGNKEGYQKIFRLKVWITALLTVVGVIVFLVGGEWLIGLYLKLSLIHIFCYVDR